MAIAFFVDSMGIQPVVFDCQGNLKTNPVERHYMLCIFRDNLKFSVMNRRIWTMNIYFKPLHMFLCFSWSRLQFYVDICNLACITFWMSSIGTFYWRFQLQKCLIAYPIMLICSLFQDQLVQMCGHHARASELFAILSCQFLKSGDNHWAY